MVNVDRYDGSFYTAEALIVEYMSLIKWKTWTWTYLTWSKEQINQGHSENTYLASVVLVSW